ncbi:MAG: DUF433 domain-containing protein [Paludibaculum sp.]
MSRRPHMYGGKDPRDLPVYLPTEAAFYLRVRPATLRAWALGRSYQTAGGAKRFEPLIELPDSSQSLLSYTNLIELHMLRLIRQDQGLKLSKVRAAIEYLKQAFRSEHPLAEHDFLTDGLDLLVDKLGGLIVVSQGGQVAIDDVVRGLLRRIEREKGQPVRFFPLPAYRVEVFKNPEPPRPVVMAPTIAFGQPVVPGTAIKVEALHERFAAQESPEEIAEDFGLKPEQVILAVQWYSYNRTILKAA